MTGHLAVGIALNQKNAHKYIKNAQDRTSAKRRVSRDETLSYGLYTLAYKAEFWNRSIDYETFHRAFLSEINEGMLRNPYERWLEPKKSLPQKIGGLFRKKQ